MASERFVPTPLKARLALLIKFVFDDDAVVCTVNIGVTPSVTPMESVVETSSPTDGLVGRINTGAAADQLAAAINVTAAINRAMFLAGRQAAERTDAFATVNLVFIVVAWAHKAVGQVAFYRRVSFSA